jgi:hypothetical protein
VSSRRLSGMTQSRKRRESRVKKLSIIIAVTALSVCLAGVVGADAQSSAKVKKIPTSLTIKFLHTTYTSSFSGKVKSSNSACVGGRKVFVIRKSNGAKIGSDVSSNNGNWKVQLQGVPKSGAYFAQTDKKKLNKKKLCGAAQSPTVQVP